MSDAKQETIQKHIQWCHSERKHAEVQLAMIEGGARWFQTVGESKPVDVTHERAERLKKTIEKMGAIIDGYGAPDA